MSGVRHRCAPLATLDAAPVVAARLSSEAIAALSEWFWSEGGGAGGALLLHDAPLFDTWLGRVAAPDHQAAVGMLGAGVAVAVLLRSEADAGSPFRTELAFDDMLSALKAVPDPTVFLPLEPGEAAGIARDLCVYAGVDLAAEACFRLCSPTCECPRADSALRFMFFAGLLAGGVSPPHCHASTPHHAA